MFLGLDLGTTNVKALVADGAGRPLAHGSSPVQLFHVGAGGIEQDLEEIWQATLTAIRQAGQAVALAEVEAIGISSQGGAMQLLDAQGQSLGRVISWLDQRGRPFDDALTAELGREWFLRHIHRGRSGLAIGQWLRLRREQPELFRAPPRLGFVGDLIVARLCGRAAHDGTSCGLTLLHNPRLRNYDPALLQRLGLATSQLPDLLSPREIAGGLRPDVAEATGLRAGIPVSAAVHDQYASALGAGAIRAGTVMVGTGTAWVLLAVNDRLTAPVIDEAFVCGHLIEGLYGQILSLVNGGSAFSWALNLLGLAGKTTAEIEALLDATRPGSAGLSFWPFLAAAGGSGLAPGTKGRWSGLQLSHGGADLLRAVVEGLAFELNRYLGFLRNAGLSVEKLVVGGGAAASGVTTQILADVTGLPLDCLRTRQASLLGAVMLARGLREPEASLADFAAAMTPSARRVTPSTDARFYQEQFRKYQPF